MSAQDALTVAYARIAQLEIARRKTFDVLNQRELEYFQCHLRGYIEGAAEQFPLTSDVIDSHVTTWLERELAQSDTNPCQSSTTTTSPLEARLAAMIVVDWYTLLLIEVHYPGIPTLDFHEGYRASVDLDLHSIRADRQAISQQYDDLQRAFRSTLIDAGTGRLTSEEVNDALDALYNNGMRSLRDKVLA